MASWSDLGFFDQTEPLRFDADFPVSVGRTYRARSNAEHLADSMGQIRVNWVGHRVGDDNTMIMHDGTDALATAFVAHFPWTVRRDGAGFGYDLRVAARTDDGAGGNWTVRAGLRPHRNPLDDHTPGVGNYNISGVALTSSTATWLLEAENTTGLKIPPTAYVSNWATVESIVTLPEFVMMRLEVIVEASSGSSHSGDTEIVGVYLREINPTSVVPA